MGGSEPTFGQRLRQYRSRAGLSQAALAERAGLAPSAIAALETGARRAPYPHTLQMLAGALGLSAAERAALVELAGRSVAGRGQARVLTPGQSTARAPSLPVWLTSFVGREAESQMVRALLDPSGSAVRLLTLVGPGGVGKTRLAVAVADGLVGAYPDGVVFVDLAPLHEPRLVPAVIARALDVRENGGRSARELVLDYLHDRQLLLLLDNFEHLLEAAPLVAELLRQCPRLAALVTSRAVLHVQGERRVEVAPLATPSPTTDPAEQELGAWPAVRLFVERAQAALPQFALEAQTGAVVAELCRRLDGMPLAIELAAARVGLLSPLALLRRMEHRLSLLNNGAVDLPDRQHTLRSTLAWSHDLLTPADQILFRRLAVFAGGWTLEAAEAVCADAELPANDVLDRLQELVDASLVRRSDDPDGEPRFGMLETIREYAAERLEAAGEVPAVERRHRDWYLALAEAVPPELLDPRHVADLAQEYGNVRAALRWTIAHGEAEPGARLGRALWALWYVRGWYAEGLAWLDELLELPGAAAPTAVRARVLTWAGHLAFCIGSYAAAQARFEEALAVAHGLGSEQEMTVALVFMALLPRTRGDLAQAEQLYEQALAIARRLGQPVWQFFVLDNLALVAERRGDAAATQALGAEALALAQAVGHQPGVAGMLSLLGRAALDRGDASSARRLLEESAALQRALGFSQGLSWSLSALGLVALAEGDAPRAARLLDEALALARDTGERLMLVRALDGIASLVAPAQPERAVRLTAAGAALHQALGAEPLPSERVRFERLQATARLALGQAAYAEAWAAGWRQSLDETISDALRAAAAEAAKAPPGTVNLHDQAPR